MGEYFNVVDADAVEVVFVVEVVDAVAELLVLLVEVIDCLGLRHGNQIFLIILIFKKNRWLIIIS